MLPDDAALERLQGELAAGADLDTACATIQPAYADWNWAARRAYRLYVESLLKERRGRID